MNEEPIAVVGMACMFPEAPHLGAFWKNIIGKVDTISEPDARWEADRYLRSGRIHTASGGYLKDLYRFDPTGFGIMPSSLDGGEPDQFLALRIAAEALADAGYLAPHADHERTGVVLGHSTYLHRGQGTLIQNHVVLDQTLELVGALCPHLDEATLQEIRTTVQKALPASNVDIAPALVPNVMTGRIANRLDLKGPNYLIDAACSSSLLAVSAALTELRTGRCKMMIAGGVNASLPPEVNVIFTQLGALSRRGKVRPFEEGSDGTLLGEGLGAVVLKRLSDARADGDRVYCVLHTVGQASDGKGQGLLAPSVEGEALAISRAYQQCGIAPSSVSNIEAHGSGIVLGDQTEISALLQVFGGKSPREPVAVGSVKSMISHCIPAAGIAGLIKTALALHHRVLPPTLCDKENPALGIAPPLFVNQEPRPWISPQSVPRRAGVNSFGFGGINAHAVLEEAPPDVQRPPSLAPLACELCVFSASSRHQLKDKLSHLDEQLKQHPEWSLEEIASALASADEGASHRLALVVRDRPALAAELSRACDRLERADPRVELRWATRGGSFFADETLGGKLAFLFPGEGSQYENMLSELSMSFEPVRKWFDFWAQIYDEAPGARRTDIVFPRPGTNTSAKLFDMDVGSEAAFIADQAMYAVLQALGVSADVLMGHSSGESAALAVAGALAASGTTEMRKAIVLLNAVYQRVLDDGNIPSGALLAVGALQRAEVLSLARTVAPDVAIAMDNCNNQLVIYCSEDNAHSLETTLCDAGAVCMRLPFARGVHTQAFEAGGRAFLEYYERVGLASPRVPLYSCATAARFPESPQAVRELSAQQWSCTVRFRETVETMYDEGVRAFLEVGPGGTLTSFVHDILKGRPYLATSSNLRQKGDVQQLLSALGQLYIDRRAFDPRALFSGRKIQRISLNAPEGREDNRRGEILLDNTLPRVRLTEETHAHLRKLGSLTTRAAPALAEPQRSAMLKTQTWTPERLTASCYLDLAQDRFLRDHVLSGTVSHDPDLLGLSCVPLMVSVEILAQACSMLAGTRDLRVISEVVALGWVALDDARATLEAEAFRIDASLGLYEAELRDEKGPVLRARYQFGASTAALCPLGALDEHHPPLFNDDELYSTGMFHGPTFQSICHIYGHDPHGIDAKLTECSLRGFLREGRLPHFVTNPIVLDAAGQLAAYFICQHEGTDFNCFPSTIERIELYPDERANDEPIYLLGRRRSVDAPDSAPDTALTWDFEYRRENGRPLIRMAGFSNVYFKVAHSFYEVRKDPARAFLGRPLESSRGVADSLWELPLLSLAFLNQSDGMFGRILAHCYLAESERREFRTSDMTPAQRRAWLLERICIKEAVRDWTLRRTGQLLYSTDIIVGYDATGNPTVSGWWDPELIVPPQLTLSRHDGAYVAKVAEWPTQPEVRTPVVEKVSVFGDGL